MAVILNIDTSVEAASVCLTKEGKALHFAINENQKDHASWLHPAIQKIISKSGFTINTLKAVSVTIGPGSYTGLRVGLSAAKGLCFALGIPLIAINTLEVMAFAVSEIEADLFCPLIDARRMEVFMAVYTNKLGEITGPKNMIIVPDSFDPLLQSNKILFSGNGSIKLKALVHHSNAIFTDIKTTAADMSYLSEKYYAEKKFADIAYVEPLYIKEFYSPAR